MDCGVTILVHVEWGHSNFEKEPYHFIKPFVAGPVQRGILAKFLGIRLLHEGVILLAIQVFGYTLRLLILIHVRCTSIFLNKQSHDVFVAVTRRPKNWRPPIVLKYDITVLVAK